MTDSDPLPPAPFEVSISPLDDGAEVEVVVRTVQDEMSALVQRLDMGARHQRVQLAENQVLELARILDIQPIEFGQDGRWELRIRTPAAGVLAQ